jgi:copper oxidase (laccase) domain-containing protein
LWKANEWLLRRAGVENITMAGICTYHQQDEFFSARRLGIRSGRILNGIFIKKK